MRRPVGVVANAPSEARLAPIPSLSTMALNSSKTRSSRSPSGRPSDERPASLHAKGGKSRAQICFQPAIRNAGVLGLTPDKMMQITGGRCQDDGHVVRPWQYDHRWEAQPILDFLYLGPSKMATNRAFLEEHKISKMVSIRDSRFADARMLYYDKLATSLGIEMECFDVPTTNSLVTEIPRVVSSINSHMLSAPVDATGASTGRVFVFCETGNIRSAAVVLAYVMSMYGESVQDCWKFATLKRFCVCLDEDTKQMLVSYEQLFHARYDVQDEAARVAACTEAASAMDIVVSCEESPASETEMPGGERGDGGWSWRSPPNGLLSASLAAPRSGSTKRSIEETMDVDDDRVEFTRAGRMGSVSREPSAEPSMLNLDHARYENRGSFAPFVDKSMAEATG